jgi:hypothetical protein
MSAGHDFAAFRRASAVEVISAVPPKHRLAHKYMRRERPGQTLQTTALVNEVYLRLIDIQ